MFKISNYLASKFPYRVCSYYKNLALRFNLTVITFSRSREYKQKEWKERLLWCLLFLDTGMVLAFMISNDIITLCCIINVTNFLKYLTTRRTQYSSNGRLVRLPSSLYLPMSSHKSWIIDSDMDLILTWRFSFRTT